MFNLFKKVSLELSDKDEQNYLLILNEIFQKLTNTNPAQAQVIKKLITLILRKNLTQFEKLMNSVEMWGGSGAVWEVFIEDENESRQFEKNMILLINLMEKTNISDRRIRHIRKIFEDNLKN